MGNMAEPVATQAERRSEASYRLGRVEAVAEQTAQNVDKLEKIVDRLVTELPLKYWSRNEHEAYEDAKRQEQVHTHELRLQERRSLRGLVVPALVGTIAAALGSAPAWILLLAQGPHS